MDHHLLTECGVAPLRGGGVGRPMMTRVYPAVADGMPMARRSVASERARGGDMMMGVTVVMMDRRRRRRRRGVDRGRERGRRDERASQKSRHHARHQGGQLVFSRTYAITRGRLTPATVSTPSARVPASPR